MLFLSILVSVGIGFLVVCFLIRKKTFGNSIIFLKLFLGIGAGFGISSCILFLCLVFFGFPARIHYVYIEVALILALFLGSIRQRSAAYSYKFIHGSSGPATGTEILSIVKFFFAAALLLDIITFIIASTTSPHGQSDAITIFNLRARFIFRDGANWATAFSSSLFWFHHMDYPPMVPLSIVRSWIYSMKETQMVAQLIGFLFTFSTIGLTTVALLLLRGQFHGYLGGLVLLGSFSLINQGVAQQADVPIAFFFLATVVMLNLEPRFPGEGGVFCLAGIMAGFSAWTKNEGILFLVSLIVVLSIKSILFMDGRNVFRGILSFFLGATPVVLVVIYFKENIAPPGDLFLSFELSSAIGKLMNGQRHIEIMKALFYEFAYCPIPILIIYALCMGTKIVDDERPSVISSIFVLVIMLIGYYIIYLFSPYDLSWHLKTSLPRLFVQLLPSIVFVFFLLIQSPEYEKQR